MKHEYRKTHLKINLNNLSHNFNVLKQCCPKEAFFCPMIKANAYGHGDVEIAQRLERDGAKVFGVALIEEGLRLRKSGIKSDILLFGFFDSDGASAIIENKFIPVISSWAQIDALSKKIKKDNCHPVHLKFNTGMHRFGFSNKEADLIKLKDFFEQSQKLRLQGLCTHLMNGEDIKPAESSDYSQGMTYRQLEIFSNIIQKFNNKSLVVHSLNSIALLKSLSCKEFKFWHQGVRPGLAIYGGMSYFNETFSLKLIMSLTSQIVHFQNVPRGQKVSYGGTWTAARDSVIGIVPIGYADGYSRSLSNSGYMLFRGRKVPVVGIVCMDYTLVDLTEILHSTSTTNKAQEGEEVVVIGNQGSQSIHIEEVAHNAGTIPYEMMTCIGSRVPRHYIDMVDVDIPDTGTSS